MGRSGNQNSIIVLATLGVYFGLILCGAAPQVWASAAMTRQFDVREEIELTDELDTIPDDERSPVTTSVQVYIEDVEYFISRLAGLRAQGKFNADIDTFSVGQATALPCLRSNKVGRYTPLKFVTSSEASRPALEFFSREMVYGYSLGDCLGNREFGDVPAVDSRFTVELDSKAFSVNITVKKGSPQLAADLVRSLESAHRQYTARTNTRIRETVLRNTRFSSLRDQVLVVTRLPRAGLASLVNA